MMQKLNSVQRRVIPTTDSLTKKRSNAQKVRGNEEDDIEDKLAASVESMVLSEEEEIQNECIVPSSKQCKSKCRDDPLGVSLYKGNPSQRHTVSSRDEGGMITTSSSKPAIRRRRSEPNHRNNEANLRLYRV